MTDKVLVILAKSYKNGKYCIAGKECIEAGNGLQIGKWIRPVTSDTGSHGAVSNLDCRLSGNGFAQVLDIVRVPLGDEKPESGQPENVLIQIGQPWEKLNELSSTKLEKFEDEPDDLWLEASGQNYRVRDNYGKSVQTSLYLIKPVNFHIVLSQEWNSNRQVYNRKIRAEFEYNGVRYANLSITDPEIRRMMADKYPEKGEEPNRMDLIKGDNYYLCVSLGPSFQGYHYKIVATVLDFGS